jgi:hypothetical protein
MNSSLKIFFSVKSLTISFGVVIGQHKFDSQQKRVFLFILESLNVLTLFTQMEKSPIKRALLRKGFPTFYLMTEKIRIVEYVINSERWKISKIE